MFLPTQLQVLSLGREKPAFGKVHPLALGMLKVVLGNRALNGAVEIL